MQATTVQGGANATVPEAPGAPAPGAVVAVGGAGGDPAAVYQGFSAQGKVLREQLEGALDERSEEIAKLTNMSGNDFAEARAGVQARIARLDKRIAGIEEQLLQVDAQTAAAAGVPGAVQPPPQYRGGDDDEESFAAGMALATVFFCCLPVREAEMAAEKRLQAAVSHPSASCGNNYQDGAAGKHCRIDGTRGRTDWRGAAIRDKAPKRTAAENSG